MGDRSEAVRNVLLLLVLQALFWVVFARVEATNFGGFDEWLYLDLCSRGIVGFPHSNRPLTLLWALPAVWIAPGSFAGFWLVHGLYLSLAGGLVFLLCLRLAPGDRLLAFLAGCFALLWAPRDVARLATVQASMNSGVTLATLAALALLVESRIRSSWPLLASAAAVAFVSARGYEATLPILMAAPFLLRRAPGRRAWPWVVAWESALLVAAALVLRPLIASPETSYQASLWGLDPRPAAVASRLVQQFALHLAPLVRHLPWPPPWESAVPAVAMFGLGCAAASGDPALPRREYARLGVLGLGAAALGYLPFLFGRFQTGATRTQFLATPGIALLLAAAARLLSSLLPRRGQAVAASLCGVWIVGLGTGHVAEMQRFWDARSLYSAQRDTLLRVASEAPALLPHTLVVLVDQTGAWPASFTFRSAVQYVYAGRATGYVWGADDALFPTRFEPAGIRCTPWPNLQGPWQAPPTLYRYDEVLAFRLSPPRTVALEETWPVELPALPEGARYAPRARIVAEAPRDGAVRRVPSAR